MSPKMFGLIILVGVLIGIGFIMPILWWCGFFGIALTVWAVSDSNSIIQSALRTFFIGIVWQGLALAPVFYGVFPFDWFGIPSLPLQILVVAFSWVITTIFFSLGMGVFGAIYYVVRMGGWHVLYIAPAAWVFSEWLGMLLFSVVSFGPGALFGAHMSFGAVGYLAANDFVLLQVASLMGLPGLSTIMIFGGSLIFLVWNKRLNLNPRIVVLGGIILTVVCVVGYLSANYLYKDHIIENQEAHSVSVAAISRYLKPHYKFEIGEEDKIILSLYELMASLKEVDVLIFPENTAFLRAFREGVLPESDKVLDKIGGGESRPVIIDSEDIVVSPGVLHSRVTYLGPDGSTYGYKQLVMPLGEYIPYIHRALLRVFGAGSFLDSIIMQRGYQSGPDGGFAEVEGVVITTRFCDEIFSSNLFRRQSLSGANILVNISSQSWFHGSPIVYSQMQTVAKVRAVENRRFLVQSGNMSPSFIIDSWGKVVNETKWGVQGVSQVDVPSLDKHTIFSKLGNEFWYFIALLVLLNLYFYRHKLLKKKDRQQ